MRNAAYLCAQWVVRLQLLGLKELDLIIPISWYASALRKIL